MRRNRRPLWDWAPISWLLTGVPGYALFVVLAHLASVAGWWADPFGYVATCVGFVGLVLGAGVWAFLVSRSERRSGL